MTGHVLTLNAGSSSLKAGLYPAGPGPARLKPAVSGLGTAPELSLDGETTPLPQGSDHGAALAAILAAIEAKRPGAAIQAVAHRIVHGGPDRAAPSRLDAAEIEALARLAPYAPLHQPHNLAGVRAAIQAFPSALQIACFDTAFHRRQPWVNDTYALPRAYYAKGVRRYGFHGLSYTYLAGVLEDRFPDLAAGRVIIAHLGNGASMAALEAGQPVATTMGFSAADGLAMGTRAGQIDPGVLLYLMTEEAMDAGAITDLLYRQSGLKGLSGLSNDMRTLEAAGTPAAAEAIAYFTTRIRAETGRLAALLEGLDALIFTAGIGENSASTRAKVCGGLGWLGAQLDPAANAAHAETISAPGSGLRLMVLPTDEEAVLADAARAALTR